MINFLVFLEMEAISREINTFFNTNRVRVRLVRLMARCIPWETMNATWMKKRYYRNI